MNLVSTQFLLSKNALEIYIAGCSPPHCKGCSNPELWDFDQGKDYKKALPGIKEKISNNKNMVKNIILVGGDPMDQYLDDLEDFIKELRKTGCKIWMFTKYWLDDIPSNIKQICDYVKCGKYDIDKISDDYYQYGIQIASTNQKIYKMDND